MSRSCRFRLSKFCLITLIVMTGIWVNKGWKRHSCIVKLSYLLPASKIEYERPLKVFDFAYPLGSIIVWQHLAFITFFVFRKITCSNILFALQQHFLTLIWTSFFMLHYVNSRCSCLFLHCLLSLYLHRLPFDLMHIHFTYVRKSFKPCIIRESVYVQVPKCIFSCSRSFKNYTVQSCGGSWVHHRSIGE